MKEESEESWIKHGYLGYCMNFESIYTGVIVWCIHSLRSWLQICLQHLVPSVII